MWQNKEAMKEQVAAQRTRESGRRFKEGMGLSTSLPPPEPNRRLLAFYNICAEYKKAIFKVGPSQFHLYTDVV